MPSKRLVSLVFLATSCGNGIPDTKIPNNVGDCEITSAPPELDSGSSADYGNPGDPGCGFEWETCLSVKAAKHYVALQMWADEQYAKCKSRAK